MDIRKTTINGKEYMFINSFRGNRSGFVHETELYCNDFFMGRKKIQYYNRTWECYCYQTVMKSVVCDLLEEIKRKYRIAWKEAHGYAMLTEVRRMQMDKDFEENPPKDYVEILKLYESL